LSSVTTNLYDDEDVDVDDDKWRWQITMTITMMKEYYKRQKYDKSTFT